MRAKSVAIHLIDFGAQFARAIERFGSSGASSVELAHGNGESHAYAIHFAPGGAIGPHPAGFDQLFLVVQGSGWVAGADGIRLSLGANRGAFVPRGEIHSKGSETGMLALMVQASKFSLPGSA
jgi:quercetin dioxygenase-like cupin family protein